MLKDLEKRVRALIYIRVIVVTILLGSFYIFRIGYAKIEHPAAFSYFIVILYLLSILYALNLRWIKKESQFIAHGYCQISIDVIAEALLLYMTGGIESMFAFLFPLSILSAGIVLSRSACYTMATLSSICYGLLLGLQFYDIISPSQTLVFSKKDFFYHIFAHIIAFYLVGFLSGYLSEKLRMTTQSLQERDTVLSDLKAFSRYIIESLPSGVFTTDLNKRIISFNTSALEITRQNQEDVIGKTPEEVFPFLKAIERPTDRIEGEMQLGGETVSVGMRFSTLKDGSGHKIGMIGVFQDLTALKAMEVEVKRKEKWAFIGELSASIAHELRNPLASLKASVEMMRERRVSGEHADRLMNIALSEMDRLNGIITDFLLYAKPQDLDKQTFDVHKSLMDVATLLRSSESVRENVKISTKLEGMLLISGDAKQIQQVFWNLGINAIHSVDKNGSIEIYTKKNVNTVEIVFSDSGEGITREEIDKIFYPFYTTKEKGTGLGLSIARKIVEEHNGRIVVDSEGRGRGATFKVILPLNN